MTTRIFAANWKMHLGPEGARQFMATFLQHYRSLPGREVWFFPSAVALETLASLVRDRPEIRVGAQHVHWEPSGAYTGETSIPMIREAGAAAALVGHSERRHVFGETDEDTARQVRAVLEHGLIPMLCVGETIEQREHGATLEVVVRQLGALAGLDPAQLARVTIAYEPVWAIGTGRTATSRDAAEVHGHIRRWLGQQGAPAETIPVLYGGSVKPTNLRELVTTRDIDGVLVGGASLDPVQWAAMTATAD